MKYTNISGLPKSIYKWLSHSEYVAGGDISVTGLLESPRVAVLNRNYGRRVAQDIKQVYKARRGTAIHSAIESANEKDRDVIQECIFFVELMGWRVKGQFDEYRISTGTLTDFKTTGVYQLDQKRDETIKKWTQQLNAYNYMFAKTTEHRPKNLEVIAMLPDEPKRYRAFSPKSTHLEPDECIYKVPIEMWPMEQAEQFLLERIELHQDNRQRFKEGQRLTECTAEERWVTDKGRAIRCEDWCPINQYCDQYNPALLV